MYPTAVAPAVASVTAELTAVGALGEPIGNATGAGGAGSDEVKTENVAEAFGELGLATR